jgi:DNA-binding MarR family transcriptional regulator
VLVVSEVVDRREAAQRIIAATQVLTRWWARDFRPGQTLQGLTATQFAILSIAAEEPDINISGIAARLDVSPPTVTRAVGALERKRLVERVRRSTHARDITLALREEGRAVRDELAARQQRQLLKLLELLDDMAVENAVQSYEAMLDAVRRLPDDDSGSDD